MLTLAGIVVEWNSEALTPEPDISLPEAFNRYTQPRRRREAQGRRRT
jgi:hypothetical protein